jgi:hypothetical protein
MLGRAPWSLARTLARGERRRRPTVLSGQRGAVPRHFGSLRSFQLRLVVDWNPCTFRQSCAFRKGRSLRRFRPRSHGDGALLGGRIPGIQPENLGRSVAGGGLAHRQTRLHRAAAQRVPCAQSRSAAERVPKCAAEFPACKQRPADVGRLTRARISAPRAHGSAGRSSRRGRRRWRPAGSSRRAGPRNLPSARRRGDRTACPIG